jgi:hypothetical protein
MKNKFMTTIFALVLVAGFAASVAVSAENDGDLHGSGDLYVKKECSKLARWGYCSILESSLESLIPVGAKIFYVTSQAMTNPPTSNPPVAPTAIPPGMMDRNVVLYVSPGNWAVGRCTVDSAVPVTPPRTQSGMCTLSDGAGSFAGFNARVDVSWIWDGVWPPPPNNLSLVEYKWEGTYSFNPEQSRKR